MHLRNKSRLGLTSHSKPEIRCSVGVWTGDITSSSGSQGSCRQDSMLLSGKSWYAGFMSFYLLTWQFIVDVTYWFMSDFIYVSTIELQVNSTLFWQYTCIVRIAIVHILTSEVGVRDGYTPAFSPHIPCHFLGNSTALAGGGSRRSVCIE